MLLLIILCLFLQTLRGNSLPSPLGSGFEVAANVTGALATNATAILSANTTGALPAECPVVPANGGQQLRSAWDIIQSCLFTIFACVWTSMHPNINGPRDSRWTCMKRRIVTTVYAVIAPEMVLLWALEQRFAGKKIADNYNKVFETLEEPEMSFWAKIEKFFRPLPKSATRRGPSLKERWTTTHGFFIQMGGFILYEDEYPKEALTYLRLEELLKDGLIDAPTVTERELQDRSKGDTISKGLVVLQTSWFVLQCVMHVVQHLPLSELEVVTLAFAVMNGAIYAAWWGKPQGVDTAIYIPLKQGKNHARADRPIYLPSSPSQTNDKHSNNLDTQSLMELDEQIEKPSWLRRNLQEDIGQHNLPVFILIRIPFRFFVWLLSPLVKMAGDNKYFTTREDLRMPMFGVGGGINSSRDHGYIAFTIGLIFGAIHLLGWRIEFHAPHDHILWQISAIVMTVAPFTLLVGGLFSEYTNGTFQNLGGFLFSAIFVLSIPFYIIARFVVIAIAFKAIVHPPHNVLIDISWTRYIPHF